MRVLLLLTITIVVKGDSSDESKYVDLLPEEEKEEFIKNLARRIVENVETKEVSNKSSVELSDDELIEHDAFVKKMLREESENVRRNKMAKAKEEIYTEEDVKVKPLENLKYLDRDDNLDLTLRNQELKVDNSEDASKISVEVVTEKIKIKTKHFGAEIAELTTNNTKENIYEFADSSKEDIQVRTIKTTTEKIVTKTENVLVSYNVTMESPEVIVNSSNETYTNSYNKDILVKNVERRAIETSTILSSKNSSGQNGFGSSAEGIDYNNKKHQSTVINDLDESKVYSDEANTDSNGTKTTEDEAITTTEATKAVTRETKVLEVLGKESFENYDLTQPTYVSVELDKSEADKDYLNETVTYDHNNNFGFNNSDIKITTPNKDLKEDHDPNTHFQVNTVENSTDTIDLNKNILNINRTENTTEVTTINNYRATVSKIDKNNHYLRSATVLPTDNVEYNSTKNIKVPFIIDNNTILKSETVSLNNLVTTDASSTKKMNDIMSVTPNSTNVNPTLKTAIPSTLLIKDKENPINNTKKLALRSEIKPQYQEVTKTHLSNIKEVIDTHKKQEITTDKKVANLTKRIFEDTTTSIFSTTIKVANTVENKDTVHQNINTAENINVTVKSNLIEKSKSEILPDIVAGRVIKILRESLMTIKDESEEKRMDSEPYHSLQKEYHKMYKNNAAKGYQVYEIPADKPPFLKGSEAITEQPYYVPVYNYSPNNAYFNAQNKLGPNPEENQSMNEMDGTGLDGIQEQIKSEDIADGYENKFGSFKDNDFNRFETQRKKFSSKDNVIKRVSYKLPRPMIMPVIVSRPVNNKSYYNLDDYADIDYYSRAGNKMRNRSNESNTRSIFPNSNEDIHPYNSIVGNNLKNHIRAARYILYHNQFFGHPTEPTTTERETTTESQKLDKTTVKYFRNGDKSSISLDYYFGRMKPKVEKDKIYNKVGYLKNSKKLRDLYMNSEYFNNNIINYIYSINHNDEKYIKQDVMTVTPHTEFKDSLRIKKDRKEKKENIDKEEDTHDAKAMTKIHSILSITDERDVFPILDKLQQSNLPIYRRDDTNVYLKVLKDMVHMNDKALEQYDWLGTTVDLQSAVQKLLDLTEAIEYSEDIHPSDLELVKFVIFLHKYAKDTSTDLAVKLRKKLILPRNKKNSKHVISDKGLVNRVWLYLRKTQTEQYSILDEFSDFLGDLQDGLYDLHQAITNIAKVTTFKKQNWFKNIKELYLSDNRSYLCLLLHMTATRLFSMIEDNSLKGMEVDFKSFVRQNKHETMKMVEEMISVIQILHQINTTKV